MTDSTLKNLADISAASSPADTDIAYVVRPSTDSDYKASLGDIKTYSATRKPQVVTTHCYFPMDVYPGNTGGRSDVQLQVRMGHIVGGQDISHLQVGTVGFYGAGSNVGQTSLGNDFTWEIGVETVSPSPVMTRQGYFRGQKSATVTNGSPLVLCDPLMLSVPADSVLYTRQSMTLADPAHKFPTDIRPSYSSSNVISPATTSQVAATGALTTPSGGTTAFARTHPSVILGIPKNPMASVLVIGDSISGGVGDGAETFANLGYISRGLASVNGHSIPWHNQGINSLALTGQKLATSPAFRDVWQYCTHAIFAMGYNDMNTSTLAVMQANALAVLNELKRTIGPYGKPLHVTVATVIPTTTSTNNWTNAAGQTTTANFAVGAKRDQYNAWLLSLVGGGLVDAVIDTTTVTDDPANPGKWYTNGTANFPVADGSHPAPGMVLRMAGVVNSWAQTIKP